MESGNTPGSFNRLVEDDVAAIVLAHDLDDRIDSLYGFVGVLHLHGKIDHAVVGSEPAGIDDLQLGLGRGLPARRGGIGLLIDGSLTAAGPWVSSVCTTACSDPAGAV